MAKIGVGIIGAGWMGSVQLQRLTERDDAKVVALCEKDAERGRTVLADLGLSQSLLVSDYRDVINKPDIDAVWVVSPNSFHAEQSLAAMAAGKHVFCEKPCATSFNDFLSLIDAELADPGLITFVDYILYFDTMEERLRNMIAGSEFGQVTQIQVNYRHPVNVAGNKVWKLSEAMMGDAIGMGINHALSVMILAMSSQAQPVSVYATSTHARVRAFEAHPIWNIVVEFDNGATGFCFGNIDSNNGYDAYHNVSGSEGAFIFDSQLDRAQKVRYWSAASTQGKWIYPLDPERCEREGQGSLAWPESTTTPDSGNVVEHQTGACVGHFIECIKAGSQSPLSFINSAIIGEIGWAARISAATGRRISVPLDREEARAFFEADI